VILHGRSLGGGAVGTIMNETSPAGIVLQSTFRSVREIASSSYPIFPISLLLRHPFDTEARARQVSTPTLILHSRADEIIPVAHGRQLAKAFPNATYVEVSDSPHNEDLIAFNADALTTYLDFIEELVPLKPN
jgi:pimeloyl-ACP methyl ester carboxylesterase